MDSRVKIAGHPVHPMLIVFPLGLLATATVFDVIFLVSNDPRWTEIAYYMIGAGVIGGLAAAPFGWIDWLGIPKGTRAKRIGLTHGIGNTVVLVLFFASWLLRRDTVSLRPTEAIVAGLAGVALAVVTGWLGGELVDRLGVGVDEGAHLNSPSSLSALPAASGRAGPSHTPLGSGWPAIERRVTPAPAYAGAERRHT